MNQYIVNEAQAKAINDGASLLIIKIEESKANEFIKSNQYSFDFGTLIEEMQKSLSGEYISHSFKKVVDHILPLKQGDEIYITEKFIHYQLQLSYKKPHGGLISETQDGEIAYTADGFDSVEEFISHEKLMVDGCVEDIYIKDNSIQPASEMTEKQSRFKFKVGEVSIKRVQNILYSEVHKALHGDEGTYIYKDIEEYFLNWLKDQGIDYSANPWVALAELKEIQDERN